MPLAEPKYFFLKPGSLLDELGKYKDQNGQVTFYDSVCGIPLFRVPVGRTLQDFVEDTKEHGWPSFHPSEVVDNNVVVKNAGVDVYSKCGTYLGTTDTEKGLRYCIDLVCVSGNPVSLTSRPTTLDRPANSVKYVDLVTFDKANTKTFFSWGLTNDPVMGGVSNSTFVISDTAKIGVFDGTVRNVPSLKAPGFCNIETSNWFAEFNDISDCTHIVVKARTTTPEYAGFKVSICADTYLPCQFFSYKANFNVTSTEFTWISIPLTDFSNDWSSYTGDCFTVDPNGKQHYCCSENDQGLKPTKPEVCLRQANLAKGVKQVGIWSEGHAGDFHLEILAVGASKESK